MGDGGDSADRPAEHHLGDRDRVIGRPTADNTVDLTVRQTVESGGWDRQTRQRYAEVLV
jgi:hypothetical protein